MIKGSGGGVNRVLAVGASASGFEIPPEEALSATGTLIVVEPDRGRAEEARQRFAARGLASRATVIRGEPNRMLHKLSGPFDAIFCHREYLALRDKLMRLLARGGQFIFDDKA